MEGIIPMVYRTLKRSSTRRQYKSLSSATAAKSGSDASSATASYDINNFYPNGYNHQLHYATLCRMEEPKGGHRRHLSFNSGEEDSVKSKQLVRFRSHRMLSCITGA